MRSETIKDLLRAIGTQPAQESAGWVRARCPLARWLHDSGRDSNPSFAITKEDAAASRFHCFTCQSGTLSHLISLLAQLDKHREYIDLQTALALVVADDSQDIKLSINDYSVVKYDQPKPDTAWPESWLASFVPVQHSEVGMNYLMYGRKNPYGQLRPVEPHIIKYCDIRFDTSRSCVAFPVRNFRGDLVGLRGRRISGGYYDYEAAKGARNPLAWLGEHRVNFHQTVLMVESVFDYASVLRIYGNVLAPLSVGISEQKAARVSDCQTIVTLFDNGAGGDKARKKIEKYLPHCTIVHRYPPAGLSDPADMTLDELRNTLGDLLQC